MMAKKKWLKAMIILHITFPLPFFLYCFYQYCLSSYKFTYIQYQYTIVSNKPFFWFALVNLYKSRFYLRKCFSVMLFWHAFSVILFVKCFLSLFVSLSPLSWQVTSQDRWPVMTGDQSWQVTGHFLSFLLSCFYILKKSVNMLIFSK